MPTLREKRLVSRTADGLKINPLYTRNDTMQSTAGMAPGTPPFTRGTKATRDGLGWDIRTFHIEADPKAANKAILEDLEGGVTSIGLQFGRQRTGADQRGGRSRTRRRDARCLPDHIRRRRTILMLPSL